MRGQSFMINKETANLIIKTGMLHDSQ